MINNTARTKESKSQECLGSDIQKDSVKTVVRTDNGSEFEISVSIVEDMFQDYCQGKIKKKDIIDKLMTAGLTENDARKYFNDIKNQILQDEL